MIQRRERPSSGSETEPQTQRMRRAPMHVVQRPLTPKRVPEHHQLRAWPAPSWCPSVIGSSLPLCTALMITKCLLCIVEKPSSLGPGLHFGAPRSSPFTCRKTAPFCTLCLPVFFDFYLLPSPPVIPLVKLTCLRSLAWQVSSKPALLFLALCPEPSPSHAARAQSVLNSGDGTGCSETVGKATKNPKWRWGGSNIQKKVNVIPINWYRSTLKMEVCKETRQDGHDGHSLR